MEVVKKFLSSHVALKTPFSLNDETKESVDTLYSKLLQHLKSKMSQDDRNQVLSAICILATAEGSVQKMIGSIALLLQDIDQKAELHELKSSDKDDKLPLVLCLKRIEKFRQYTELTAFTPASYLRKSSLHHVTYLSSIFTLQ